MSRNVTIKLSGEEILAFDRFVQAVRHGAGPAEMMNLTREKILKQALFHTMNLAYSQAQQLNKEGTENGSDSNLGNGVASHGDSGSRDTNADLESASGSESTSSSLPSDSEVVTS